MKAQYVTLSPAIQKYGTKKRTVNWSIEQYEQWIRRQHELHPELGYNLSVLVEMFFEKFYKPTWPDLRSRRTNSIAKAYENLLSYGELYVKSVDGSHRTFIKKSHLNTKSQ